MRFLTNIVGYLEHWAWSLSWCTYWITGMYRVVNTLNISKHKKIRTIFFKTIILLLVF